mgnify:CR=1 FL=1
MKATRVFEVYPDKAGLYRWRTKARNGQTVATSNESFDSAGNASKAARREAKLMRNDMTVEVVILDEPKKSSKL